jgi:flagellar protein FlaG
VTWIFLVKELVMNVDTISSLGSSLLPRTSPAEEVDSQRKTKEEKADDPQVSANESKVQPEELLASIKSITQDGLYSVRFEQFKDTNELIVQIFDNETEEVIRQIPAEELLELKMTIEELRGNLVNTEA